MASLTGNLISSTYQSVLKIGTNNTASANLNNVTDGAGNVTGLYVSTATTAVSGTFAVLGSMTVSGVLAATSSNAISASFAATAQTASYILNAVSSSYAQTASYIQNAQTASYVLNAVSSSYAVTSSFAITASNANLLDGLDSSAFALLSGSNAITGSINLNGRLSFNAQQGNFVFPSTPAQSPITGSAYFSGSALYIYNGAIYLTASLT
jgi:hypothetical protein